MDKTLSWGISRAASSSRTFFVAIVTPLISLLGTHVVECDDTTPAATYMHFILCLPLVASQQPKMIIPYPFSPLSQKACICSSALQGGQLISSFFLQNIYLMFLYLEITLISSIHSSNTLSICTGNCSSQDNFVDFLFLFSPEFDLSQFRSSQNASWVFRIPMYR